jgi:hypothetical protein
MATSKGVIQGYTGVAAVDDRHQIIVEAQAHGTGSEQELLVAVVKAMAPQLGPRDTIAIAAMRSRPIDDSPRPSPLSK